MLRGLQVEEASQVELDLRDVDVAEGRHHPHVDQQRRRVLPRDVRVLVLHPQHPETRLLVLHRSEEDRQDVRIREADGRPEEVVDVGREGRLEVAWAFPGLLEERRELRLSAFQFFDRAESQAAEPPRHIHAELHAQPTERIARERERELVRVDALIFGRDVLHRPSSVEGVHHAFRRSLERVFRPPGLVLQRLEVRTAVLLAVRIHWHPLAADADILGDPELMNGLRLGREAREAAVTGRGRLLVVVRHCE